ncbi:hypothetical protein Hdeb2414_s0008g00283621 [Helianthus debilis subsp. tardiflorus]
MAVAVQLEIWVLLSLVLVSIQDPVFVVTQNLTCNSNDLTGLRGFMSGCAAHNRGSKLLWRRVRFSGDASSDDGGFLAV